jgi:hypothetical protein
MVFIENSSVSSPLDPLLNHPVLPLPRPRFHPRGRVFFLDFALSFLAIATCGKYVMLVFFQPGGDVGVFP